MANEEHNDTIRWSVNLVDHAVVADPNLPESGRLELLPCFGKPLKDLQSFGYPWPNRARELSERLRCLGGK